MELSDINLSLSDAVSICEGIVLRPGKFEGQPSIAPYLHPLSLEGEGEQLASLEDDGYFAVAIQLEEHEVKAFSLNPHPNEHEKDVPFVYVLSEDLNGFGSACTLEEYRKWEEEQFYNLAIVRQNCD